jgi:hypothetical protein
LPLSLGLLDCLGTAAAAAVALRLVLLRLLRRLLLLWR